MLSIFVIHPTNWNHFLLPSHHNHHSTTSQASLHSSRDASALHRTFAIVSLPHSRWVSTSWPSHCWISSSSGCNAQWVDHTVYTLCSSIFSWEEMARWCPYSACGRCMLFASSMALRCIASWSPFNHPHIPIVTVFFKLTSLASFKTIRFGDIRTLSTKKPLKW